MDNINDLKALLGTPRDIVITTHRNPDGDAMGSSLGLYHFLNKGGHTVRVITPSEYPEAFAWMPDAERITIYDLDPEYSEELVGRADLIFCLDFNALDRIDKLGELVGPAKAEKVMIDHHLYPEGFADFVLSDTSASSTCELVFDFVHLLGQEQELDDVIGACLFTGIITDTGSFRYSTSPKLYRTVANLVELGVDDYKVQDYINNSLREKHLKLLGHCLNNRMEILPEYHTGIIYLTKKDYEDFDIQRGDTEGIVNYLLKVKEVKMAAFITEQPTIVKISLRSKGDFSVQEIARKHFKGGGHQNASGGFSFQPLEVTLKRFKALLPQYKSKLEATTV
ncbi:DHH family phosphoesterase [Phaeodactylibacter luteus]|uniref:Bifunctional oligoribonuclease/PAP phosphatase NrnA n=1 Tax=Phaeodactylibacter luteus TaxID=1564516 RepID=A0A5C6S304_9BACT|nr:bifunctional oligoribonuclease/PAP phosphatase NrnA [Phaeodactylibacter luteus]TXB68868.1 bifunctional oligoribonuclease/PAP phosphatase NrnA [Phaeodactylibacter luteus]